MGRPKTNKFSLMSVEEMIDYFHSRYQIHGIVSLSYPSIKQEKGLYFHLYKKGLTIKSVIEKLGLHDEYRKFKTDNFTKVVNGKVHRRWSWKRVLKEANSVVGTHGFLPPAQWFQQNKMGSLVFSVYNLGKDWNDLRRHFNSYENSDFVESRNGIRWRSHPEASFSNFLYTRGVEHKKGEKYPEAFQQNTTMSYGYYDLHFKSISGNWIDVEIWGDKPKGHAEDHYKEKRVQKEAFNKINPNFLGIHYADCYEDSKLDTILNPYIGYIEPYIFDKPTDKVLQPTHWSNADELIDLCREIARKQPDGIFPTEEWLRKRGKWKYREGTVYNTVSIYIKKWIGGVRKLRKILGQEDFSTTLWTKKIAIQEYKKWFGEYGFTPSQARTKSRGLTKDEINKASTICIAVAKYVGSIKEINSLLKIQPIKKTKWNKEIILEESDRIFSKYSLSPTQIANFSARDQDLFDVDPSDIAISKQLVSSIGAYFTSVKEIYKELGIQVMDIRIMRKHRKTMQSGWRS